MFENLYDLSTVKQYEDHLLGALPPLVAKLNLKDKSKLIKSDF